MFLRKLRGEVRENVEQVERAHAENRCFQPRPLYQIPKIIKYFDVKYPVAPDTLEMLHRGHSGDFTLVFWLSWRSRMKSCDPNYQSGKRRRNAFANRASFG